MTNFPGRFCCASARATAMEPLRSAGLNTTQTVRLSFTLTHCGTIKNTFGLEIKTSKNKCRYGFCLNFGWKSNPFCKRLVLCLFRRATDSLCGALHEEGTLCRLTSRHHSKLPGDGRRQRPGKPSALPISQYT